MPARSAPPASSDIDAEVTTLFEELATCADGDARGAELRDRIVALMLPLAQNLARRFAGRGVDLDDLHQVAGLGLVQAVNRFDPSRGSDFVSFAIPTITGEVKRYFRDHSWATRVPRRVKDLSLALSTATETLAQRLGRSPTAAELAGELGVDVGEVIEAVAAQGSYSAQSLDSPVSREGEQGVTLADTLAADDAALENAENYLALRPILDRLPDRQKRIVVMRFFEERTQTEIAREVGISQVHVSRLLAKTFEQIRAELDD